MDARDWAAPGFSRSPSGPSSASSGPRLHAAVRLGDVYVELFRNIPLLVQMFLWYFVLPEMVPTAFGIWLKQLPNASFYTAVVALGLYMSARVAEQVRAGILSLPRGQRQAALALGLTLPQTYVYVLLPMAYRLILPPLTSEFLNIIKNSAVALTIGLMELTARARSMQEFSFQVFEAFTAATVIYIVINITVTAAMRRPRAACRGSRLHRFRAASRDALRRCSPISTLTSSPRLALHVLSGHDVHVDADGARNDGRHHVRHAAWR